MSAIPLTRYRARVSFCCGHCRTAICASDVHFMDHPELGVDDPTGRSLYDADRDIVLGHEFVGEVIGHGPGCTDQFPVGSRVTSMPIRLVNGGADGTRIIGQHPEAQGSFAELLVIAEPIAKAVDGDVSSDAVALIDAFAVGEFYVRSANLQADEVPIVVGAGAIGLSAVAALAARGSRADHRRPTTKPSVATWHATSSGHTSSSTPPSDRAFDVVREVRAERGTVGPRSHFRMRRRRGTDPEDRRIGGYGHPDLLRGRLVHRGHVWTSRRRRVRA